MFTTANPILKSFILVQVMMRSINPRNLRPWIAQTFLSEKNCKHDCKQQKKHVETMRWAPPLPESFRPSGVCVCEAVETKNERDGCTKK